jgi:hypothetical protein
LSSASVIADVSATKMLRSEATQAWFRIAVPAGRTFSMEIYDRMGWIYFELFDSSGKNISPGRMNPEEWNIKITGTKQQLTFLKCI